MQYSSANNQSRIGVFVVMHVTCSNLFCIHFSKVDHEVVNSVFFLIPVSFFFLYDSSYNRIFSTES